MVRVQSFFSDSLLFIRPQPLIKRLQPDRAGSGDLIGSASGVILSSDGYIMTNAHVLAGGDSLRVILQDRRSYRAILIGMDDIADLALLKVSAAALPFLEFGDPDRVQIGEQVLAVGNPLELTSTVTAGILSARYRNIDDDLTLSSINSFLQTDAAINEGMSGSALVNRDGKLIGINAAIISPSGTFAGYSFAVPSDLVKKAFQDLSVYRRVRHGCLDAGFTDMDEAQARRLGITSTRGVLVEKVLKNGAGYRVGLRENDVIVMVNQRPVNFAPELRELLAVHNPGDQVLLTLERSGKSISITAVLSENDYRRDLAGRSGSRSLKQVVHKH